MIDVDKQIEYWTTGAEADIDTAGILIKKRKYLHGLFFCHLAIEKIIKANVAKGTHQTPPKSHNLFRLLEDAGIEMEDEDIEFLGILMKYQLEGRYPDYSPQVPDKKTVRGYFRKTREIMAKKEIVRLIQELLKRLFQEGISVEKAFLYGSHARGEENEESDIDILLVSALFDQNDDQVVGRTWRISRSIDSRLEPYTIGKEKFSNDHISPLIQIVKKEGVEIRV